VARDADPVLALELVRPAGHILASRQALITSAGTVPVPITNPGLVNARDAILTLEFTGQAMRRMRGSVRTTLANKNPSSYLVNCTPPSALLSDVQLTECTSSSEPSGQSRSPSQRHLDVMQKFSEQLNSESGAQGVFGQSFSSELSPQSSSRSQTQRF